VSAVLESWGQYVVVALLLGIAVVVGFAGGGIRGVRARRRRVGAALMVVVVDLVARTRRMGVGSLAAER
jgi:hypothetical protein